MNLIFRRAPLFLAVAAVVIIAAVLLSGPNHTRPTDCGIARIWYETHAKTITDVDSFETFLEERFRTGDIVSPGGLFTGPEYSVAIHYPQTDRAKVYDFQISRDGTLLSLRSISISLQEWSRHRKITCDDTNGEME